jgi:hypothetical protein
MKKGMCRGCDNLTKTLQTVFYRKDNVTRFDPPRKVMKQFCRGYGLHMEYVRRLLKQKEHCPKYQSEGMT